MTPPLLPALPGYDSLELIAYGTTALVFRAIQSRLNRPVAIKVIIVDTGAVPVNAERELATTVALSSQPHIVSIIDTGMTEDERPYIVMEYCEGGSYAQILRQNGPLSVDDVLEVGIKIGEALHAAHEVGIVHRDVKPSNILRSRFGPALTDFGIARAPDELGSTLTREMMTPHHASPEALLHQAQSGPSDIYSLASTMWTLLVGHPPFVDPDHPAIDMYVFRDKVLHDQLPSMPRVDVPAWLAGELTKAMAKLPAQRHGSALEFANALRRGALGLSPSESSGGIAGTSVTAAASQTSWPVHVPGVPPQAWPTPEPPVGLSASVSPAPVPTTPVAASTSAPSPGVPPSVTDSSMLDDLDADGPIYRPALAPRGAKPAPQYHPLSGTDERASPTTPDEGGWLGVDTESDASRGWPEAPDPTTEPFPGTRRFTDRVVPAPSGGRRGGLMAVLIGVTLIALASGALLALRSNGRPQSVPPADPLASVTPTLISPKTTGAPTDLAIDTDRGNSVTLAWTDPTGGTASFVVIQRPANGETAKTLSVGPGAAKKTATFTNLRTDRNYCFAVSIVYSVNDVAISPDVCTHR
jgi:serine/threonine-protein kinase PknK